jgi:hypothetical protein
VGTKKKRGLTKESYANCLIFHQLIIPIILHTIRDRMGRLVPRVFKKKASKPDQKHSWKVFDANEQCHDVAR